MASKTISAKQRAYIEHHITKGGNKRQAAKAAKVDESTVYRWLKDEKFLEELNKTQDVWYDELHQYALQRAKNSDTVLIFMLKSLQPEKHDDAIRKLKYMKDNDIQEPDKEIVFKIEDAASAILNTRTSLDEEANSRPRKKGNSSKRGTR